MALSTNLPSCSVALCTYNGERYIAEQLESILSQSKIPDELVVVDDCSADRTPEIVQSFGPRFPSFKFIQMKKNVGPVQAFSLAIKETSHPYIFLSDQDDHWKEEKIEQMLVESTKYSLSVPLLMFSDLEVIDENGNSIHPSFWKRTGIDPKKATFRSLLYANVATGCATMINSSMKSLLASIPNGVMMHDHWIALIAFGMGNVAVVDDNLVKYRAHGQAVTSKAQASFLWKLKIQWEQFWDSSDSYLEAELDQADQFKNHFFSFLSKEKQDALEKFLLLKNQPFWQRKWRSSRKFS